MDEDPIEIKPNEFYKKPKKQKPKKYRKNNTNYEINIIHFLAIGLILFQIYKLLTILFVKTPLT